MKFLALIAAAFAYTESELTELAMPKEKLVKAELAKFKTKFMKLVQVMKSLDGVDRKLTKAFLKKHAPKVKTWMAQRKAMKAKFMSILKNAKSALMKAKIPAQVKTLKAMDKALAMRVVKDVKAFMKEGMALKKMRMAVAKKTVGPKMMDAMKAGKGAAKAIFA